MRIPFLNTFVIGFIFIYFIMISSVYLSQKTSKELYKSYDWIEHTYEVINLLDGIEINLFQTSADARGYFIYPDPEVYKNFAKDTIIVWQLMDTLRHLTKDNSEQQRNIDDLKLLIEDRLDLIQFLWLRGPHKDKETIRLGIEATDRSNTRIFSLHKKMTAMEKSLLDKRKGIALIDMSKAKNYNLLSAIGTFFIGLLFINMLKKDLKRRKIIENELRDLNDNKNKFFSIISHDLRGPIYAAQQLSELITEKKYNVNEKEKSTMTEMMKLSIKKVTYLLEDLLEWSKVQMERIEFKKESLSLKGITNESIDRYRIMIDNKKLQVHNLITDDCFVLGDRYMISTVMRNLINNAIKFSKENKSILVSCQSYKETFIEISVKDEGIGMSKESQEKLFNIGIRQSSKGTSSEPGSGLGLILVKEFVEKQGGTIRVESEEGKGSNFIFTIPKSPIENKSIPQRKGVRRSIARWNQNKEIK